MQTSGRTLVKRTELTCAGAALAFLAGCASTPSRAAKMPEAAPQAVVAPVITPVSGTDLDQANMENVRAGETLKSYPVGRYLDPEDSNVMHEAHVVYRKEAGSSWNLHPNAPTVVPLGPVLAVGDPARSPTPLPAELEQRMAEQNQLVASLIEQNEALTRELGKISQEIAVLRQRSVAPESEDKR
jgi:hypothetical protein